MATDKRIKDGFVSLILLLKRWCLPKKEYICSECGKSLFVENSKPLLCPFCKMENAEFISKQELCKRKENEISKIENDLYLNKKNRGALKSEIKRIKSYRYVNADTEISSDEIETNDFDKYLGLINLYYQEWQHREETFWKQVFKFYFATLTVIFLPNIAAHFNFTPPDFPYWIFPVVGFLMTLVFFYISYGYAIRLKASSETYKKVNNLLCNKYKRISLERITKWRFITKPISTKSCIFMSGSLLALCVFMLIYHLVNQNHVYGSPETLVKSAEELIKQCQNLIDSMK